MDRVTDDFLNASDLRSTDNPRSFTCKASVLGSPRGHFPGSIDTDVGNGGTLVLDRPIFDERGNFVGVAYRQGGGCEVLVLVD